MVQQAAPKRGGTRFRIFPQARFGASLRPPVEIELSPPAGTVGIGPQDARMCVIQPEGKTWSYGELFLRDAPRRAPLPPWRGAVAAPARPGPDGGFAHLEPEDPEFDQAHAYACVRLALDVWEGYLGRSVPWYFGRRWLEIGLLGQTYNNGEVGWGWLELGWDLSPDRPPHAFARNLDVIAHEVGHLLVYGTVGPSHGPPSAEYSGFHEAAADLVALLVCASLEPVVAEVLSRTRGNLYVANELNRLGELSSSTQIRLASNSTRMSEFALGWSNEHDLSEPLTGAIFDLFLDMYQSNLVEMRLIPASLIERVEEFGHLRAFAPLIQAEFDRHYPRDPAAFAGALADARDRIGRYLAFVFAWLPAERLTYVDVRDALRQADLSLGGGRFAAAIDLSFAWREIGSVAVGPYLGIDLGFRANLLHGVHRCAQRDSLERTAAIAT